MKILLAEDDPQIGAGIVQGLRQGGFTVDWIQDGAAAERASRTEGYALLILDLGLPSLDGTSLLERLRNRGCIIPVLILTARDSVADRIQGLNLGADDYLVKPFDFGELLARLHALMRRGQGRGRELRLGRLCVTPVTRTVTLDNVEINFSAREFALLHVLMEMPGAVLSIRQLEERLYGWNEEVASNAVEVLLHRVRQKLGNQWIRNIRGVGYKIVERS